MLIKQISMEKTKSATIQEQIILALDGRTQRWLSFRAQIPESDLSRKMNDKDTFTQEEVDRINEVLNCSIKFKAAK